METSLHVTIATIVIISASLQFITACPVPCVCNGTQVSCVNQSITAVPGDIPEASAVVSLDLHSNHISILANVFQSYMDIQVLDLSHNDLSVILQEDLQNNTKLRNLNLSSNVISEIHPEAFLALQNLTVLNLDDNSISTLPTELLHGMHYLDTLSLQRNSLSKLSEDIFNNVHSLTFLDLSFNEIRDIFGVFETIPNLVTLNMSHNKVNIVDGQNFHGNNSLAHLNLSHNNIHTINNLSYLVHLVTLDLSWNNISEISSNTFEGLFNLTDLRLNGNMIESINTSVFRDLQSLQTLSLSHMPNLKYLSPHTFDGLDRLLALNLHHNQQLSFIHKQLFLPLKFISIIDISFNHIEFLPREIFLNNTQLTSLDLQGNSLTCDCNLEWLLNNMTLNDSIIRNIDALTCRMSNQTSQSGLALDNSVHHLTNISLQDLHCSQVEIVYHSPDREFKIGRSATLQCVAEGVPTPEITWITPRKRVLHYHNFHQYSRLDYLPLNDSTIHARYHASHVWHEQQSYYSESEDRPDRIVILEDGSLYIDYVLRSDGGPYRCIAKNPRNTSEIVINFYLDYSVLDEVKIWSLVVGGACAGSFFLLNLIYSFSLAAVRRCISQRRRERMRQIIETMDQYKTMQLTRIKENYTHQVGRIRDQYHYQLGRLRESHQSKVSRMGRMREGASLKVDKLRDNYNNQLGRLKDYSSSQMVQIREKYNNQIYRIKDYGSDKFDRIHEKYRLKQQHVIKLIEMMNLDNCKTVFDHECVRTESMILDSDIFTTDVPIHGPLDSVSVSDSEYLTATSSESSKYTSRENLALQASDADSDTVFSPVSHSVLVNVNDTYQVVNEEQIETAQYDPLLSSEASGVLKFEASGMVKPEASGMLKAEASGGLEPEASGSRQTGEEADNAHQIKAAKRRSVKSRKLRESVKRRSKSEMVLILPHDDFGEHVDLLPASSHKKSVSRDHGLNVKLSHRRELDVEAMFSGDIPQSSEFDDVQPSTSGANNKDIDVTVKFPSGIVRESTV